MKKFINIFQGQDRGLSFLPAVLRGEKGMFFNIYKHILRIFLIFVVLIFCEIGFSKVFAINQPNLSKNIPKKIQIQCKDEAVKKKNIDTSNKKNLNRLNKIEPLKKLENSKFINGKSKSNLSSEIVKKPNVKKVNLTRDISKSTKNTTENTTKDATKDNICDTDQLKNKKILQIRNLMLLLYPFLDDVD